ncbi:TetR/AcrR family transcriptional regulator [Stomatohabitans albus]|uniref:TetR/AcrR family transcriptional regulator n=1 Tax=Stomatohabitans albus TaxID=3110766 RepID=UPI00300CEF12
MDRHFGPKGQMTQSRILKAATTVFVRNEGRIELEEIAQEAGVSMGLLYRYFPSKGTIQAAVVESYYDRLDKAIWQPIENFETYRQQESKRIMLYIAFQTADPVGRIVLTYVGWLPEAQEVVERRGQRFVALVEASLAHGQESGVIDELLDIDLAAPMLLSAINTAISIGLKDPSIEADRITFAALKHFDRIAFS